MVDSRLRARLRRLLKRAEAKVIASAMGVTAGTVRRWRRSGIPKARIEQLAVQFPAKTTVPKRFPASVRYERRLSKRGTHIWEAEVLYEVKTKAEAIQVTSLLLSKLSHIRPPKGATFQWVIRGVSTHEPDQFIRGAYHATELRARGKKARTSLTILPKHAFGRLDVCADTLVKKLSTLEAFFKTTDISIIIRKARKQQ